MCETFPHLRSIQANDAIHIPGTVEEVRHRYCMFTCRNPVLLGGRVDLEDVGPCAEDGLFSMGEERNGEERTKQKSVNTVASVDV